VEKEGWGGHGPKTGQSAIEEEEELNGQSPSSEADSHLANQGILQQLWTLPYATRIQSTNSHPIY
jgi:hypothetical protein